MKKIAFLLFLSSLAIPVNATEHHSGHAGGAVGGGGGSSHCIKAHLGKFTPPHLAKAKPGSQFSFIVTNIHSPKQVKVTVKKMPVEFTAEFKDPFYLITGKLPETLKNTMARIEVKVDAKRPSCGAEGGWLVNIAEE